MDRGVRTFSRVEWEAADDAWAAGEFSDEWTPFRELARARGILYPPAGTRWDSWEDPGPSQRAILVRAIRDTPELLRRTIGHSRSWSQVIAGLVETIGEMRDEVAADEETLARQRAEIRAERQHAPERLGDVMRRAVDR